MRVPICFGTEGFRGVIAQDFIFVTLSRLAGAYGRHLLGRGPRGGGARHPFPGGRLCQALGRAHPAGRGHLGRDEVALRRGLGLLLGLGDGARGPDLRRGHKARSCPGAFGGGQGATATTMRLQFTPCFPCG